MATDFFGVKKGLNIKPGTLPATGTLGDIAYDEATSSLKQWNGANWGTIAGANGIPNVVTGGDAEGNNPFTTYKDAAAVRPVDGSGGSPTTVSSAISATSPILGQNSFVLTKSAANGQGEGWAITLDTILPAYRAKVMDISFDYMVNSGTFVAGSSGVDSDVIVYLYDVTNSTLIEPSSIKFLSNSTTLADKFRASFQTSATGSSYRLIFHVTSSLSNAFSLKVDNIAVSPSQYVYGTPITDPVAFSPTLTNMPNVSFNTSYQQRCGKMLKVWGRIVLSGVITGDIQIGLPSGLAIDSTQTSAEASLIWGKWNYFDASDSSRTYSSADSAYRYGDLRVRYQSTTTVALGTNYYLTNASQPIPWATGDQIFYEYEVPISGWSSSVQMSDQTDTRVVDMMVTKTSNEAVTANTTNITYGTTLRDSHGSWNGTHYTVPVAGDYLVVHSGAALTTVNAALYVNNTSYSGIGALRSDSQSSGAILVPSLKVGDLISIRSTGTQTIVGDAAKTTTLSISRISGPNQIAASESVVARYTSSAGNSVASGSATIVDFATKDYDSHNATTTGASWKFTAPVSGTYVITPMTSFVNTSWASATVQFEAYVYKNGSTSYAVDISNSKVTAAQYVTLKGSVTVRLVAGDYIDYRISQTNGTSINLLANSVFNHITITRVGN